MASSQVITEAMLKVTKAFRPSPAAIAKGTLPTTPMRIDSTPATKAVPAATSGTLATVPSPMNSPVTSLPLARIRGLSTTM